MAIAFGAALGQGFNCGSGAAIAVNITSAVPSGAMVIVGGTFYNATTTSSMSGGGLTWTLDQQQSGISDTSRQVVIYSAPAPSGLSSGTTLTLTPPGGSFARSIAPAYFTGVATSSYDDGGDGDAQLGTAWDADPITTTNADDLLVAHAWGDGTDTSSTATAPANEHIDFQIGSGCGTVTGVYRIVSSTGTYTLSGTWATSVNWTAASSAYKADAGVVWPPPGSENAAETLRVVSSGLTF